MHENGQYDPENSWAKDVLNFMPCVRLVSLCCFSVRSADLACMQALRLGREGKACSNLVSLSTRESEFNKPATTRGTQRCPVPHACDGAQRLGAAGAAARPALAHEAGCWRRAKRPPEAAAGPGRGFREHLGVRPDGRGRPASDAGARSPRPPLSHGDPCVPAGRWPVGAASPLRAGHCNQALGTAHGWARRCAGSPARQRAVRAVPPSLRWVGSAECARSSAGVMGRAKGKGQPFSSASGPLP